MSYLNNLVLNGNRTGTLFMALFLMRLPMDMRDHIVAKNFTDCREMAEYANRIHSGRKSAAVTEATAVSTVDNRHRSPSPRAEWSGAECRWSPSCQGCTGAQTLAPQRLLLVTRLLGKKTKKCRPSCTWQVEN